MPTRTVRVTRIWEVEVEAQYGDTDDDLLAKANAGTIAAASETKNLLPDAEGNG